jgi:6-phosphogluconolactonase
MNTTHPRGRLLLVTILSWLPVALLSVGCSQDQPARRDDSRAAKPADAYWVYFGTYTGAKSKGIYRARFDPASGSLSQPGVAAETPSPSFLAADPQHRFLYAVNEVDQFQGEKSGSVSSFGVDARTGTLSPINQKTSSGAGPCHLTVDSAGRNVLVANYAGGTVSVLPADDGGRLGDPTTVIHHQGTGPNSQRQDAPHAHCITLDRTNRFALANDLGLDKVMVYRFDPNAGKFTPNDPPSASVAPGAGPRHLAFSPDERFAYVNNEMALTVTAFAYDAARGTLRELQSLPTVPEGTGPAGNSTAEVRVHPSGKFVYVSNRGPDSIAIFQADTKTGKLTAAGHQATQGKTPRSFSIDPTGRFLLAANQNSDTVVVFRIDSESGKLTPTGTTVSVPAAVCVEFVPVRH